LKDGVHKGDENDPRISIIQVVPEEIRYWLPTKGTIGRAIETGVSKMTGKVAAPGELRTITKAEVRASPSFASSKLICGADPADPGFTYKVNAIIQSTLYFYTEIIVNSLRFANGCRSLSLSK
jgi:hypothetical protein